MTLKEFSDEFDVLYNSITSAEAPGLNGYEKSVFLTKAQEEVVLGFFNPRTNKTQEGFDDNEKRQIDFSMIMRSLTFKSSDTPNPFGDPIFDVRPGNVSLTLGKDNRIFIILNELVKVTRDSINTPLVVVPISYMEYTRLMSKPYKRPASNQAWRLMGGVDNSSKKIELILGSTDKIQSYSIRYIRRPQAIILEPLKGEGVSIDGETKQQDCELDPILHPTILQRAVELAKAAYVGDLQSQIALGQASQTSLGAVQTSR